jgi:Leucine-rich repeat (LRR) protein
MLNGLYVGQNIISDFSCIKEIPALMGLDIWGMPILSLNELGEMPYLESLSVGNTPLISLEGIEKFKSLTKLNINSCGRIKDLTPLLLLPELEILQISDDMREYAEEIQDEAEFEIVYD